MSTPASRKLLKSCPNLPVALARSWVVPLDAWTTSLADWFRPAATLLSLAWTSWKLLPLDGNYSRKRKTMRSASSNMEYVSGPLTQRIFTTKPTKQVQKTTESTSVLFLDFILYVVLTESARRVLLASPTVRMALSTSLWPGRQFTHLFRAWDTALATYTHARTMFSVKLPTPAISFASCIAQGKQLVCVTWASLCWLSASPGLAMALLVSSIRLADLSMTSPAQSSVALRAGTSSVVAATPLAADARDFRAWATSLAAIPGFRTGHERGR